MERWNAIKRKCAGLTDSVSEGSAMVLKGLDNAGQEASEPPGDEKRTVAEPLRRESAHFSVSAVNLSTHAAEAGGVTHVPTVGVAEMRRQQQPFLQCLEEYSKSECCSSSLWVLFPHIFIFPSEASEHPAFL